MKTISIIVFLFIVGGNCLYPVEDNSELLLVLADIAESGDEVINRLVDKKL